MGAPPSGLAHWGDFPDLPMRYFPYPLEFLAWAKPLNAPQQGSALPARRVKSVLGPCFKAWRKRTAKRNAMA